MFYHSAILPTNSFSHCSAVIKARSSIFLRSHPEPLPNDAYLFDIANELNASPKDLRVGHSNICSLRNKIEELRMVRSICRSLQLLNVI